MKKNCVNCGAPIDINEHKCPYCSTTYFDNFMTLDLINNTPVVFKAKTPQGIITMLCKPRPDVEMSINNNYQYCYGENGNKIIAFSSGRECNVLMKFDSIPMKTGELFKINVTKEE